MALSDAAAYRRNPTTARADAAEGTALAADLCFGMAVTLGVTTLVLLLLPSKASSGRKAQYGTIVTF